MTQKQPQKKKRMRAWVQKHPGAALLLGCYGAALLVALIWHLGGFSVNRAAYNSGNLAHAELTLDDFTLVDLERREDDVLVSLGGDPQLVLKDTARRVENLEVDVTYSRDPLQQVVYWAEPGQDYALRRMAYPGPGGAFLLPPAGGRSLRFDPGTVKDNEITITRIAVNTGRPFWAFFVPSAGEAATLAVLPGLVAAALMTVLQAFPRLAGRGDDGPGGRGQGGRKNTRKNARITAHRKGAGAHG